MASGSDARGGGLPLFVLGANHLTAPVDLRDKLLLDEERRARLAAWILGEGGASEAVLFSTCNRTEVYGVHPDPAGLRAALAERWADLAGEAASRLDAHAYFHHGGDAVRHLFRVTGSLDSLVLGEMQIFGQVKDAYQKAVEAGWADFTLNHVFQTAMHTGKRVHAETGIHEGAVSISYAAIELARKVLGDLRGKQVGVVGTGEMGELATQHLHKAGATGFRFFNRSLEGAERMAATYGGRASLLGELEAGLSECDIVISATGSPEIVIAASQVRQAMRKRHGAPLFLIDIAAPRDIDPEAGEVEGTFLFTIDDLKSVVAENLAQREQEAQKALAIVEEEAERIEAWSHALAVVPLLKGMRERVLEQAEAEARKRGAGRPPEEQENLLALARGLANKFLHLPTARLKRLGESGDGARANYYAAQLFGLDASPDGRGDADGRA